MQYSKLHIRYNGTSCIVRGLELRVIGIVNSEKALHFADVITARRNARIANAVLATAIPSVCLSVCLSVRHTPVLCQNDVM